jgi:hypothetical protein
VKKTIKSLIENCRNLGEFFDSNARGKSESHLQYAESGMDGDPTDHERINAIVLALMALID